MGAAHYNEPPMKKILFVLAALCMTGLACAQDYPSRPVHLIVPYTPGTGADIQAADWYGRTPLWAAIECMSPCTTMVLLALPRVLM